jgi:hypothetical protein
VYLIRSADALQEEESGPNGGAQVGVGVIELHKIPLFGLITSFIIPQIWSFQLLYNCFSKKLYFVYLIRSAASQDQGVKNHMEALVKVCNVLNPFLYLYHAY